MTSTYVVISLYKDTSSGRRTSPATVVLASFEPTEEDNLSTKNETR